MNPKNTREPVDLIDTLDAAMDQKSPDVSVLTLAKHAEQLAGNLRPLLEPLAKAKVTTSDADQLDHLAACLRDAENRWQSARKEATNGAVAKARIPLTAGRDLLFGGVDAFVDEAKVGAELAEIGGIDNDDDLESDTRRLIKLARTYESDFDGTEINPEHVTSVEKALKAFREARKGETGAALAASEAPSEATRQALTESARVALERRNRVFWALAALDRAVCKRGRFCFRDDEKRRRLFAAYTTEGRRTKKAAVVLPTE